MKSTSHLRHSIDESTLTPVPSPSLVGHESIRRGTSDNYPTPAPLYKTMTPVLSYTEDAPSPVLRLLLRPSGQSWSQPSPTRSSPAGQSHRQSPTFSTTGSYPVTGTNSTYNNKTTPSESDQLVAILIFIFLGVAVIFIACLILRCELLKRQQAAIEREASVGTAESPALSMADTQVAIKAMTSQQRQDYIKAYLRTKKFSDAAKFKLNSSGRFTVTSSQRNLTAAPAPTASTCAICLEDFTNGDDICRSQHKDCHHEFHLACAFTWLSTHQDCPCCRRDYLTMSQARRRHVVSRSDGPPTALEDSTISRHVGATPTALSDPTEVLADSLEDWIAIAAALDGLQTVVPDEATASTRESNSITERLETWTSLTA